MSAIISIEWTDATWNPVRGCSVISPGCHHCYAMKQAHRFSGPGKPYEGLTKQTKAGPQWTGVVRPVEDVLLEPLSWRKPRRVFVNSMSDLFHEDVPFEFIDKVFAVMALCPQHTFQVLTKRADRMHDYLTKASEADDITVAKFEITGEAWDFFHSPRVDLPLPNVWLGVSVENQQYADERIPLLLQTPAAIRFISAEPLLDHLNICPWIEADWSPSLHWWKWSPVKPKPVIDWVICSGESGPGARVCRPHWFRNIVGPCKASKTTKVFVKQLGSHIITRNDDGWEGDTPRSWPMDTAYDEDLSGFRDGYQGAPVRVRLKDRKGGDPSEWPEDLRVREFPA